MSFLTPVHMLSGSRDAGKKFSDPFILPSSEGMPQEFNSVLDYSLYLYYLLPLYRQATNRVVGHFLTDFKFGGKTGSKEEREELKELLTDAIDFKALQLRAGREWGCFAAGTRAVTKDGVFPIEQLVGRTVPVLSKGGVYRPATFKSFGVQPLMRVTFSDGREVYATPEHVWEVIGSGGKGLELETRQLTSMHRIERTVARRLGERADLAGEAASGYIGIRSVEPTDRVEEVFCCVEMETHRFVIEDDILTGNCYGNGFMAMYLPFDRYLVDRRDDRTEFHDVSKFPEELCKYDHKAMRYLVPDPRQDNKPPGERDKIELSFFDRKSMDVSRVTLRFIDPRDVVLLYSPFGGSAQVVDRISQEIKNSVTTSAMHVIRDTPLEYLEAISKNESFLYKREEVFHFKEPTVSGVSNHGWGIPNVIQNYRSIHQMMVLHKVDEAVGLDYMLPFRVLTPNLGNQAGENAIRTLMGPWKKEIGNMVATRRKDPFRFHSLPFPVQYQELGGTGKSLAPKDSLQYHGDALLDGMGYPAELFRGSMNVQAIPTGVRLFESANWFLSSNFNRMLQWFVKRLQQHRQQSQIDIAMSPPRVADDLENRQIYLQMGASGEIPRSVAWSPWNIGDPIAAAKERMLEDAGIQEEQQKVQAEMERKMTVGSIGQILQQQAAAAQQAGGAAGGAPGAAHPAPGGQPSGITPLRVQDDARAKAMDLLQNYTDGQRRVELQKLEATNEQYYAVIKQQIDKIRREGESAGRANAVQIAQGG